MISSSESQHCWDYSTCHPQTGANLATEFLSVLQDWSLQDKVHVVLRDNARNISKATRDANIDSIGCTAHTIQLVIHC